jgi:hypothetical protein
MRLPLVFGLVLAGLLFAASAHAAVIEVEGVQDSLAGAPAINHCTLRKAIINANTNAATYPQCASGTPGVDTINFLLPGTVTFALAGIMEEAALTGDLDVTEPVIINGHADGTIIDGADLDRIFDVHVGASLELNDITLRNATALGWGGGIYADGASVTLNRVTITGNHVSGGDGGAVYANNSTLVVHNSTISGNTAAHIAGGIIISGGTATAAITNSTVTGNSSGFSNLPGGISQGGTSFTLRNTIVAGNGGIDSPNLAGTFTSLGYNIVGSYGTNPPTIAPTTGDQLNVSDALVLLGPLGSNGGPTQTHALNAGSIALDKGHASGATTDQRGLTRPCDDGSIANAAGGDGGDVGAFEQQVVCVVGNPPDAVDDAATVAQDSGPNAIDVLANDSDPDSDPLTITAVTQGANGSVTFTGISVSYAPNAGFTGSDSFTYTISDGNGGTDTATVMVTVNDTQPPTISASVAVSSLWPPNHKLVDVGLVYNATDNSPGVTTTVTVYSDEDDGATPDAVGSLLLRAERDGTGDGRVYLIVITATDAYGNTSQSCLTVVVPKSMSAAHIASVNAQAAAAQSACSGAGMFVVGD